MAVCSARRKPLVSSALSNSASVRPTICVFEQGSQTRAGKHVTARANRLDPDEAAKGFHEREQTGRAGALSPCSSSHASSVGALLDVLGVRFHQGSIHCAAALGRFRQFQDRDQTPFGLRMLTSFGITSGHWIPKNEETCSLHQNAGPG